MCYVYYVTVAEAPDRQQSLSRAQPLSDINQETTTTYQELNEYLQPVNYQQLPTPAEPQNYYNVTNAAQDTSTANSPYEELDITDKDLPSINS